ncbi:MAG: stage II sporulation protein P [Oscillospiraceae bacterium]|nr:stage II sporulation protein P [Oscillospiraceae bacterium]
MPRLKKRSKRVLVKIAAGITVVLISPALSSLAGEQKDTLISLWQNEAETISNRSETGNRLHSLEMSNSALLLYKPADGEIIPQTLPFPESKNEPDETEYEPSFSEPAAQVFSLNITDTREEPVIFEEVDGRIVKTTFAPNGGEKFLNLNLAGQVRNETGLDNSFVLSEAGKTPDIKLTLNGEPEILIMHTHTTEAYQPCEYDYFDASYYGRSFDSSRNIVAVGAEIAKSFAQAGITVIHDGTVHDSPQFSGAYARSAETVNQILKAYPSIKVVLDIHRDAIDGGDGSRIAAVAQVDGRDAAQIMIISAADDGTYDMPHYLQNFRLASLFQQYTEFNYPDITRPVLFQYCQYNQQLTTGSLLIEVGAYGNTLEEAKYAGQLIGKSMAEALISINLLEN